MKSFSWTVTREIVSGGASGLDQLPGASEYPFDKGELEHIKKMRVYDSYETHYTINNGEEKVTIYIERTE